ncbi:MAG: prepilin-type N-terminal cleavage/methylation domain-containing protein, partial [bacterium]
MNRAWRKRRAFTLVEILLVMAILAVVSAVTVPSFVRSIRGNRLRTAGRTVVAVTRYARSMALLHQREVVITFMPGNSTIVITSLDRPMAVLQATGEVETAIAEARARMIQASTASTGRLATAVRERSGTGEDGSTASPVVPSPEMQSDVYLTRVLDGV